ncbi:MAG: hypothetical protein EXS36_14635 [Pedosphaera sp.]|nr:hypothetical protein [Pedosphaera sp.]
MSPPPKPERIPEEFLPWIDQLALRLEALRQDPATTAGHLEERIRQSCLELHRLLLEGEMQLRADSVELVCEKCGHPLVKGGRARTKFIRTMAGEMHFSRGFGTCRACDAIRFPADHSLGLSKDSIASPLLQEVSALLVSLKPAEHAATASQRVCGIPLNHASLSRDARRQGERALEIRPELDRRRPAASTLGQTQPKPFTLVIQIDAMNLRERDFWNETEAKRRRGEEFTRWHWTYTATCFRLEQRCVQGKKQRAFITERSYIATMEGVEPMMKELHAEALRRGLASAERVLVLADGAVWIWNAVGDRFPEAVQRLDLYHAKSYLWAVANETFGAGSKEGRKWLKPLLKKLRADKAPDVIQTLQELAPKLTPADAKEAARRAIEYYSNNEKRLKYVEGERRNEPVGSGAIESTCRQLQCRMKRCGQF